MVPDGLSPHSDHTAIWTGAEMVVWGGVLADRSDVLQDGFRFDPVTNLWTALPMIGAPSARQAHTAIWTGNEMIVWGGINNVYRNSSFGQLQDGGRWQP